MSTSDIGATLGRRETITALVSKRGDGIIVTGLGSTTYDVAAVDESPLNFYVWGGMGGAAMVGLGLALAQPARRVLVATGDGEMLMGLGALATIAVQRPANLALVVMDNEHYAETGMQHTHTRFGVDLAGMAAAAGFGNARTVRTGAELEALAGELFQAPGPLFAAVKVRAEKVANVLPSRDGPHLKHRFRQALLGEP
jgi:thiamine pyrophosphate-dependent acetolactate synthase large subunit-like protein